MNIIVIDKNDIKESKKILEDALQLLQFMYIISDKKEAQEIHKTCKLLVNHLNYIDNIKTYQ